MPKIQSKKLNNNNIGRKKIQAKRKVINKMGQKSDILLKKMNGNGKNTRERGFVAKLPKFNYDENGNTPVRKGVKLAIQNDISKLPIPILNEKPSSIISKASCSSIETTSTVTAEPEIKKPEETFAKTEESIYENPVEVYDLKPVTDIGVEKSSNNNGAKLTIQNEISKLPTQTLNLNDEKPLGIISEASSSSIETISTVTLQKILKNTRWSLEYFSNKLSGEDIDSDVGKETWKDLYEKIDEEEDCEKLFRLVKKIANIFKIIIENCEDEGGYLPDNFKDCFESQHSNYQTLSQEEIKTDLVGLNEHFDKIGELKEEKIEILDFYEGKKLESSEEDEQDYEFLSWQDVDVVDGYINDCEIMALAATKAEIYLSLKN